MAKKTAFDTPFRNAPDHQAPLANPNAEPQNRAPAGPFFTQSELPVTSVIGGNPASMNGYTASATNPPMPPNSAAYAPKPE